MQLQTPAAVVEVKAVLLVLRVWAPMVALVL
jgi:hypothetical protein